MKLTLFFATLAVIVGQSARAEVVTNERHSFQTEIVNTCAAEPETIAVEGEYHILIEKLYSNGKYKYIYKINASGKGVTASGKEYIYNDTNHLVETHQDPPPTLQVRRLDYLRLVGKGRTPNLFVRWQLRWFTDFVNPPTEEQKYEVDCH